MLVLCCCFPGRYALATEYHLVITTVLITVVTISAGPHSLESSASVATRTPSSFLGHRAGVSVPISVPRYDNSFVDGIFVAPSQTGESSATGSSAHVHPFLAFTASPRARRIGASSGPAH